MIDLSKFIYSYLILYTQDQRCEMYYVFDFFRNTSFMRVSPFVSHIWKFYLSFTFFIFIYFLFIIYIREANGFIKIYSFHVLHHCFSYRSKYLWGQSNHI